MGEFFSHRGASDNCRCLDGCIDVGDAFVRRHRRTPQRKHGLRFNLVDEKFKGLNESIDQVRSELSDFKASYEERVRYLERERMEAANLEAAENVDIAEVDEQRPRVATSQ